MFIFSLDDDARERMRNGDLWLVGRVRNVDVGTPTCMGQWLVPSQVAFSCSANSFRIFGENLKKFTRMNRIAKREIFIFKIETFISVRVYSQKWRERVTDAARRCWRAHKNPNPRGKRFLYKKIMCLAGPTDR